MKAMRENPSVKRAGDNYLDKDFNVGDRVQLNAKGAAKEVYGHYADMVRGRKGTIQRIPTERWNSNCVDVKWDDAEVGSVLGVWALDLEK